MIYDCKFRSVWQKKMFLLKCKLFWEMGVFQNFQN